MKQGILLVAFGTSLPQGRIALDNIDRIARDRFEGVDIRWAYTSSFIRRILARQDIPYHSPLIALARMHEEGYTHVAVQSLHVAAGSEFHDLAKTVAGFREGEHAFDAIVLGKPLLSRKRDVERAIDAVISSLPKHDEKDAVVLMGHGRKDGTAELSFVAVDAMLQLRNPRAWLGTIEGVPTLEDVLVKVDKFRPKRVFLVPFMLVAGDHACNDLAGDDPDSWKSKLEKRGTECVPLLHGLGENDDVAAVWMDHLATALKKLELTVIT